MARRTVVTMPGDGIGKVVLPEAVRVLEAVRFEADYVHAEIGWDCWIQEGTPFRIGPSICWPGTSWGCSARSPRSRRRRPTPN